MGVTEWWWRRGLEQRCLERRCRRGFSPDCAGCGVTAGAEGLRSRLKPLPQWAHQGQRCSGAALWEGLQPRLCRLRRCRWGRGFTVAAEAAPTVGPSGATMFGSSVVGGASAPTVSAAELLLGQGTLRSRLKPLPQWAHQGQRCSGAALWEGLQPRLCRLRSCCWGRGFTVAAEAAPTVGLSGRGPPPPRVNGPSVQWAHQINRPIRRTGPSASMRPSGSRPTSASIHDRLVFRRPQQVRMLHAASPMLQQRMGEYRAEDDGHAKVELRRQLALFAQ